MLFNHYWKNQSTKPNCANVELHPVLNEIQQYSSKGMWACNTKLLNANIKPERTNLTRMKSKLISHEK
jgi:hypothetical protein